MSINYSKCAQRREREREQFTGRERTVLPLLPAVISILRSRPCLPPPRYVICSWQLATHVPARARQLYIRLLYAGIVNREKLGVIASRCDYNICNGKDCKRSFLFFYFCFAISHTALFCTLPRGENVQRLSCRRYLSKTRERLKSGAINVGP